MRVTTKGQVTIPKTIRDRLGIGPGSDVEFIERVDGVVELVGAAQSALREKVVRRSLDEWFRMVEGSGDSGLTSDEIMKITRGIDARDAG